VPLIRHIDKKTLLLLATEISLAICLIYSLFYLASSLGISYYVLSDRGMVEKVVSGSVLSSPWDVAVWGIAVFVVMACLLIGLEPKVFRGYFRSFSGAGLLGLLCVFFVWVCLVVVGLVGMVSLVFVSFLLLGLCLVFAPDFFRLNRSGLAYRVLFGGLLLVLFVELASFVLFSVPTVMGLEPGVLGLHWGGVELGFASLAYPFLPYVYLLFVLFGLGAFVFRVLPSGWLWLVGRVRGGRFVDGLNFALESGEDWGFGFLRGRFVVAFAVVVSAVVSCLFVVFTVLPWSNPTGMMVSVDSPIYFNWVSHMRSVDVNSALSFAFSNDRAFFLVICYALSFVAPIVSVIQFAPAFLLVLLSVVSVFVLRLFTSSRKVLVLGALLVPFSFQGLGLIYSGYFANMLALILVLVYVVLFFKLLDKWSSLGFLALLGVSVLVLFSHSWTWFVFALSLVMFLFLEGRLAAGDGGLRGRFKGKAVLVGATVGVGLLIDVLRRFLSPVSSSASALGTAQSSLGFPNPVFLVTGMQKAVDFILGGVFANQLLVVLSFVGFLVLLRFKSEVSNFFVGWVFVVCVSILFAAGDVVFNRALFMLPWVVLSGLGLAFIIRFVGHRVGLAGNFRGWRLWVVLLVLAFVFLVLLNSSLRYLFNINIW
jgi:hypothetical protein